jgi:DNA-binding transcriptional ArsR family regulator
MRSTVQTGHTERPKDLGYGYMISIQLEVEDLADTHFAISPLGETVHSLWALSDPSRHTLHLPWLRWVRACVDPSDLELLTALVGPALIPSGFRAGLSRALPDFLTPRPTRFEMGFGEQLQGVRLTPVRSVRDDLLATHAPDPPPQRLRSLQRSPGRLLQEICDALERYWEQCLLPLWPRMRLVLEADTTYRAGCLASGGARSLFADIHPNVSWQHGSLNIAEMVGEHTVAAGRGLLLIPSIFAIKPVPPLDPGQPPWLVYPCRGTGTLWAPAATLERSALVALLGQTRTQLLEMLEEPLATIELARRLGVTPSAVSQHLQVLARSRLVTRSRDRRMVLYRRSPLGDQLTRADDPDPSSLPAI